MDHWDTVDIGAGNYGNLNFIAFKIWLTIRNISQVCHEN